MQDINGRSHIRSSFRFICVTGLLLAVKHTQTHLNVLLSYREVPMKEAKEFAESIAAIFIETSARNAVNVEELFQKISRFNASYCSCQWVYTE